MAKTSWRRDPHDTDTPWTSEANEECALCVKNDRTNTREGAWKRLPHYLQIAADYGTDALMTHLTLYIRAWYGADAERAHEAIRSHMAWVWDEIRTYTGLVDAHTGAPLSWHTGRQQAITEMHAYYVRCEADALAREHAKSTRLRMPLSRSTTNDPEPLPHSGLAGQVNYRENEEDTQWLNEDMD